MDRGKCNWNCCESNKNWGCGKSNTNHWGGCGQKNNCEDKKEENKFSCFSCECEKKQCPCGHEEFGKENYGFNHGYGYDHFYSQGY